MAKTQRTACRIPTRELVEGNATHDNADAMVLNTVRGESEGSVLMILLAHGGV